MKLTKGITAGGGIEDSPLHVGVFKEPSVIAWQSSGWDSVIPLQGAWVPFLARELRSGHVTKTKKNLKIIILLSDWQALKAYRKIRTLLCMCDL